MKKVKTKIARGAWWAAVALLAIAPALLAGCGGAKVKPESRSTSELKRPGVARLGSDREGFIIAEAPRMSEASIKEFQQALVLLEDKQYEAGIELLEKVIERTPGVSAPYIDLAIAYARIGKIERAEMHFKTAVTLIPGHPVACNEYGLLLRRSGRFAEAREIFEKSIALFPEYAPLHRNLGILCDLYLNDAPGALQQYEIYSSAVPDDKQVKLWIADLKGRLAKQQR